MFSACVCVCVCVYVCVYVLFTYTIYISIICASQEETSLIAINQQINNLQVNTLWKEKTLWKHCDIKSEYQ